MLYATITFWPTDILDKPIGQMTIKILLQLGGAILLFVFGIIFLLASSATFGSLHWFSPKVKGTPIDPKAGSPKRIGLILVAMFTGFTIAPVVGLVMAYFGASEDTQIITVNLVGLSIMWLIIWYMRKRRLHE